MFGSAAASIIIPGTDKRRACRERAMRCLYDLEDRTRYGDADGKNPLSPKIMPEIGAKTSTGGARSEFRSDRDTRQAKTSTLSQSESVSCTLRITPESPTRHLPGVRHSPHRVPHVYPYIESPLRDGEARMHAIASLQRPGVLPSDLEGHMQRWAESAPWEPKTAPNQLTFGSTRELIGEEKKAAERARANAINAARQAAVSCAEAKEKVQLPAQRSP